MWLAHGMELAAFDMNGNTFPRNLFWFTGLGRYGIKKEMP